MTRFFALLLLLTGCAGTRLTPEVMTFPSELPASSALQLARNVLGRTGWPASPPAGRTLTTNWHPTESGLLRLVLTAKEARGGASTVVSVRGEQQVDGRAIGVTRGAAAWPEIEQVAGRVGSGIRYALY